VVRYGYPLEEHFVETPSGYVLRVFRIKHGRKQQPQQQQQQQRPVVHLQHGLLGAGSDWALNGPGYSLAFVLADAGYDVFLGNVRANTYSRNHTRLDPSSAAFWAFTWDEIASEDLPAMLSMELELTGADALAYVGHSQGTTVLLALLASRPEWAAKISLGVLLAPVAVATHVASPFLVALARLNTDLLFELLGVHEFLPSGAALAAFDTGLCRAEPALCVNALAMIAGYNPSNIDSARLPVYLNHTPSGTSVVNMEHWCQAVRARDPRAFSMFDFGTRCATARGAPRACNQRAYGRLEPPEYNLSRITTPLALFAGGRDRLADPADFAILEDLLLVPPTPARLRQRHQQQRRWSSPVAAANPTSVVVATRVQNDYEHLDYLWGIDAPARVHRPVLDLLRRYGGAAKAVQSS
jgi:pimeloyl-ACP methyl ester carboxylesterase